MDETPIKAGRSGHGKMKTTQLLGPQYGDQNEVCFPVPAQSQPRAVAALLGARPPPGTVLHTDGYAAYEAYAKANHITHAQCWAHARRELALRCTTRSPGVPGSLLSTSPEFTPWRTLSANAGSRAKPSVSSGSWK
ncbi:MAG: transposase [Steroidobacteraceae bacterium]